MKQTIGYSLKVWLTTAIVSPVATSIALAVTQQSGDKVAETMTFYLASVVYGMAFSLIPFFIMWFVVRMLSVRLSSVVNVKLILLFIGLAIIAASILWLVHGNADSHPVFLIVPYSLVLALSIFLYKFESTEELGVVPFKE